jgi:LmbE family N-acetylglucosaminyl deacetylase
MRGDVLVVSPHCDDAVFACGDFLATHPGAVVLTVFAGRPAPGSALTDWDAAAGFRAADEVIAARRAEDRAALDLLGAVPLWMDFRDAQYGPSPTPNDLIQAIGPLLETLRPRTLVLPLGLFHSDHDLAHRATLALAKPVRGRAVFWYEDAIYRRLPGLVAERVRTLVRSGFPVRRSAPVRAGGASSRKRWAVRCYRSQLRALDGPGRPGIADAFHEEALWRLACA